MFASTISREEINELPLDGYKGKIHLITKEDQLASVFKKISDHKIVGFDTESKPTFRKGEYNHVAMIQIAIPEEVFLIRINYTGITDEILRFLENEHITKIGVALRDDLKDLNKLRPAKHKGFVELNKMVTEIGIESNGLRKLTAIILGFRISKNAQVSNWEAEKLTQKQLQYAATDAWVCLEMYNKLEQKGYVE
ncbi:3'-5' exonuclease domain-containing protein 2 [Fulvivirga sp. RKSG066]|uniref:3'-5' exonuclease n=1 Tax=Fulvivirga aurantia TaxID=2529383 RepID=UPI0012BB73B8|nr:3'-5' exonuclease [Fulvivirga aurantia]MTI22186.1 3'-5' exonuclease domain-containing protein 2 [Fulvivirga aurantia]